MGRSKGKQSGSAFKMLVNFKILTSFKILTKWEKVQMNIMQRRKRLYQLTLILFAFFILLSFNPLTFF